MKVTGQLGAQKKYGQLDVNSSFQTGPKRHCVGHSVIMENSTKVFFLPSLTPANLTHTSAWLPKIVVILLPGTAGHVVWLCENTLVLDSLLSNWIPGWLLWHQLAAATTKSKAFHQEMTELQESTRRTSEEQQENILKNGWFPVRKLQVSSYRMIFHWTASSRDCGCDLRAKKAFFCLFFSFWRQRTCNQQLISQSGLLGVPAMNELLILGPYTNNRTVIWKGNTHLRWSRWCLVHCASHGRRKQDCDRARVDSHLHLQSWTMLDSSATYSVCRTGSSPPQSTAQIS